MIECGDLALQQLQIMPRIEDQIGFGVAALMAGDDLCAADDQNSVDEAFDQHLAMANQGNATAACSRRLLRAAIPRLPGLCSGLARAYAAPN